MYDVIIIGGGPAGLTAGLYASRAGLNAVLIEMGFAGGQAATTDRLENYPGFPDGIGGPELMSRFEQQAVNLGLEILYDSVTAVDLSGETKKVTTSQSEISGKTVIIATGAVPRKLGVPGEDENIGRGVSYCATCDGAFYRGKTVAVVGGNDTAAEDCAYLSRHSDVYLIHRRTSLRVTGRGADHILKNEHVTPKLGYQVRLITRSAEGLILTLHQNDTDLEEKLSVSAVFIAVGTQPVSELIRSQLTLDDTGRIIASEDTRTSIPGVFAAGDIRTKPLRQIVTAASDGAVAAYMAQEYLNQ